MANIKLLYIDLFCGAGGTSSGVEYASLHGEKCAKVVACVDHDKNAILSHAANHPNVMHFTEDIRTLELSPMVARLQKMRVNHHGAHVVLWASLECTNFSRAKGGQPRDAGSRTLAEHLYRYIETISPDYIQIENVEEFMYWGELDEHGKPVSKDKGCSYLRWIHHVQRYGYDFDWRVLNAADFGAYTSRKRYFGLFAKHGLPIAFPVATHAKHVVSGGLFDIYEKWKPVKEVLDLDDEGTSIFEKKKPMCERTLERIYAGLVKFVAGGKKKLVSANQFLMNPQYNSKGRSIEDPCFTLIARMDRMPPYLVSTERGASGIAIFDDDSPMMRKVKEFMAMYGFIDIKTRMLKIVELKKIMGFPAGYTLIGTQAEQKKFIGNAVEVNMSRVLCETLCAKLEKRAKPAENQSC